MTGTKGKPSRAGAKFWGKLQARVHGLTGWNDHDHGASWDDGGASDALGRDVADRAKQIIADQTREAVAEYVTDASFAMGSAGGQIIIAINMASAGSRLIVQVPLAELMNKALADAYASVAHPASQEFISAVLKTTGDMAKLRQEMTRTQPAAVRDEVVA